MTVSIRISKSDAPIREEVGGIVGALTGGYTTVAGGSTDIEIAADDEFASADEVAGFVQEVASVAAATFRHATLGEIVTSFEGEVIVDDAAKEEATPESEEGPFDEVPFPEAGDDHPFEREDKPDDEEASLADRAHAEILRAAEETYGIGPYSRRVADQSVAYLRAAGIID